MTITKPEKIWTWGNILTTVVTTLTLGTLIYGGILKFASVDANANALRDLTLAENSLSQRVNTIELSDRDLHNSVDELKQRRLEDVAEFKGMRTEIVGRLERIEGKIDNKADKPSGQVPREWQR